MCRFVLISYRNTSDVCAEGERVHHHDNPSIFDELTQEEIQEVTTFMYNQDQLKVKQREDVTVNSTYIYVMEILPPVKSEALNYLDRDGSRPQRFAKVILHR